MSATTTYERKSDIDPQSKYFAISFTASDSGGIEYGIQTHWAGWADGEFGRELREASLVRPEAMVRLWAGAGQPCLVVNEEPDLFVFLRVGGNALVEEGLAREHLPDLLGPNETRRETPLGWRSLRSIEKGRLQRAPTKKLRMQVLKRDGRRCRICGRRPDDCVDLELHVHHVRPWGRPTFGLTEAANLITLCHTCHDGLEPHGDESLYEYIPEARLRSALSRQDDKFKNGVQQYRDVVGRLVHEEDLT